MESVRPSASLAVLPTFVLTTTNSYQKLNPGAKLDNYETPKAFVLMIAKAVDGRYGDPDACMKTVRQYWKNTTAGIDREGEPVDPKIIESTTNVS